MHKFFAALSIAPALAFSQTVNVQALDLVALTPIESITQATDIRPFLRPGVPPKMMREALRRAWVVDPLIRDYRGLQENQWEFDNPSGIPGFGPIEAGESVSIMQLMASVSWAARTPRSVSADASRSTGALALFCRLLSPLCSKA